MLSVYVNPSGNPLKISKYSHMQKIVLNKRFRNMSALVNRCRNDEDMACLHADVKYGAVLAFTRQLCLYYFFIY